MARNQVQFQKGLSEARFAEIYGTEEQCHAALVKWRWPNGFECPGCNGASPASSRAARGVYSSATRVASRPLSKRERSSLRKLPLRIIDVPGTQSRACDELVDALASPNSSWMMKHKLAQVMLERNASKRLKGNVQMDDAYIGGARSVRRGRGATGKTPFVAAIATTDDGEPDQIILRPIKAFSSFAIRKLANTALNPGANIVSDGLACFAAVTQAGCLHTSIKTGSGKQAARTPVAEMGQYRVGQYQSRPRGDLPSRARKTRSSISRGVRISI